MGGGGLRKQGAPKIDPQVVEFPYNKDPNKAPLSSGIPIRKYSTPKSLFRMVNDRTNTVISVVLGYHNFNRIVQSTLRKLLPVLLAYLVSRVLVFLFRLPYNATPQPKYRSLRQKGSQPSANATKAAPSTHGGNSRPRIYGMFF